MSQHGPPIDGKMINSALSMEVVNPSTEEITARAPRPSETKSILAVAAVKVASLSWPALPVGERRIRIAAMDDVVVAYADELAKQLTTLLGKPLVNAKPEVMATAVVFRMRYDYELPLKVIPNSECH